MATRMPLAAVSQNAINARPSMGAPARKSLQGRPSLVGPARTSTGGNNPAAPRRMTMCPKSFLRPDEPRDVKSVAFRNSAIERIIEFLVTHGYEHQISPKQLGNGGSGPSNKDFAQIFVFLYRQLDTHYKYPKDVKDFKLEDEVPAIFKMLRYPVAITKSQMSTIGAPHAWPYLLAALDWLVELLTYQQQLAAEEQDGIDPADTDKMFFLYTKRSYKAWMEDESGASLDIIERELNEQFACKNVVLEQEIQKMQAEVSMMESELGTLRPSLLDDLQRQRSATLEKTEHTIADSKALEVQIRELEGSISQLESDNDKRGMHSSKSVPVVSVALIARFQSLKFVLPATRKPIFARASRCSRFPALTSSVSQATGRNWTKPCKICCPESLRLS
jgi:kinetochore protein NDC80